MTLAGSYGSRPAADLELLSTIVYADRESNQAGERTSFAELRRKVKPGSR
jgi:hypothetical protein